MRASSKLAGWPLISSIGAHVLLASAAILAYRSLASRPPPPTTAPSPSAETVAIELPQVSEGTMLSDHEEVPEGATPVAHGGATVARMDTGAAGRGGTTAGRPATNLAASEDQLDMSPDLRSHWDRDQHQRLRTAPKRATREDRRSTTQPMELTFLASGSGEHPERRAAAATDPSRGSLASPRPAERGGQPGAREDGMPADAPRSVPGSSQLGELASSPGLGVRDGVPGEDHRAGARVAKGRPSVTEAAVAIPAIDRARPNDTVDSDQAVANIVRAQVHASYAGGTYGTGRGGQEAPTPDPGAGGAGRGSVSAPLGAGDGDVFDWFSTDPRLLPYFRKIHGKVNPLWRDAFPKSAMLELKQGTVILEFTIASDGTARVTWPPLRPSGIDEFDRNCAEAIRRASPFPPLPPELGRKTLRIRAPFVAKNPIVK